MPWGQQLVSRTAPPLARPAWFGGMGVEVSLGPASPLIPGGCLLKEEGKETTPGLQKEAGAATFDF